MRFQFVGIFVQDKFSRQADCRMVGYNSQKNESGNNENKAKEKFIYCFKFSIFPHIACPPHSMHTSSTEIL